MLKVQSRCNLNLRDRSEERPETYWAIGLIIMVLKSAAHSPGIVKMGLLCLIFVVLWNSGLIVAKYGMGYVGPITLLAYRYVLVVALLIVIVSITKSWRKISLRLLACHTCIGILSHAIFLGSGNIAMDLGVSAGLVAFIAALQPLITAVLSPFVAGELTSYRQWIGLALGVSAVLLVVSDKIVLSGSVIAYTLPFVAILALSIASLIDRRISLNREAKPTTATPLSLICLIHCTSALGVLLPAAAVFEQFEIQWGFEVIFSILWLTVFLSIGAFWLMFYLLRHLSATRVASLGYLGPPVTMLMGYLVFNEQLGLIDLAGLAVAGLAVWFVVSDSGVKFRRVRSTTEMIPANYSASERTQERFLCNLVPQTQLDHRLQLAKKYKFKLNRFSKPRSGAWLYEDTYRH